LSIKVNFIDRNWDYDELLTMVVKLFNSLIFIFDICLKISALVLVYMHFGVKT